MTSKQIEYVLEVAKTKNFGRAAENLFISQPTVTYQIKELEEEIGFPIFNRSGKGAELTPAGSQFLITLKALHQTLLNAIEQGQNFNASFTDTLRIVLPIRSALYFLPDAIRTFGLSHPDIEIVPSFDWDKGQESFLLGEKDILFAMEHEMRQASDTVCHHLFNSRIYLITGKADPLAKKDIIHSENLAGKTLMIGGGSPPALRALQQQLIQNPSVHYFNSPDHDTTLTNVAAGRGVCLAPGFLNDHNHEFAWIPFETKIVIPCALYTHKNDKRPMVREFVDLLEKLYKDHPHFDV